MRTKALRQQMTGLSSTTIIVSSAMRYRSLRTILLPLRERFGTEGIGSDYSRGSYGNTSQNTGHIVSVVRATQDTRGSHWKSAAGGRKDLLVTSYQGSLPDWGARLHQLAFLNGEMAFQKVFEGAAFVHLSSACSLPPPAAPLHRDSSKEKLP